ncbi:hypothetical protein LTR85_007384 [Meristemomyces frigidus]|nr:hypothetical protein LTR85_007384 [Meristemomyces frigidus]
MDPLSIARNLVALISFAANTVSSLSTAYGVPKTVWTDAVESVRDYGLIRGILLNTIFLEAKSVTIRVKRHVIGKGKGPEEAQEMKKSYTESFTMLGVAGALVAQIAITALSLPNIEAIHWTVQACFIISLIAGCLSVYYSCVVQLILSGLHGGKEVANWLARPRIAYGFEKKVVDDIEAEAEKPGFHVKRIPSLNSALMLVAPAALLNFSLAAFLVGLGIYLGLVFSEHLGSLRGTQATLAVLIVYIVFTSCALISFYVPTGMKVIETALLDVDDETLERNAAKLNGWQWVRRPDNTPLVAAAVNTSPSTSASVSGASLESSRPSNQDLETMQVEPAVGNVSGIVSALEEVIQL